MNFWIELQLLQLNLADELKASKCFKAAFPFSLQEAQNVIFEICFICKN